MAQRAHITSTRLQMFYDEFMKNSGSVESLRKLFRLLHVDQERRLPEEVAIALVSTACDDTLPSNARHICLHVLHEILPDNNVQLQDLQVGAEKFSPNLSELSLAYQQKCLSSYGNKLVEQINQQHGDAEVKMRAVRVLVQLLHSTSTFLEEDEINKPDSLFSTFKKFLFPESMRLSKSLTSRRSSTSGVIELDGTPTSQFPTVLNISDVVDNDHLLNVQTFSALNQLWAFLFEVKEDQPSIPRAELVNQIVVYCLRILEQSERVALKSIDSNYQRAAMTEAVRLLDKACSVESSHVIRVFPVIRRVCSKAANVEVGLPALQFVLRHGQEVAYDPTNLLDRFLEDGILSSFKNLCSSCEIILFLKSNLKDLNGMPCRPLLKFFPNVFKIYAWFPMTFASDFCDILPTFLSPSTAVEVLHCILDLPLMTAAMVREAEDAELAHTSRPPAVVSLMKTLLRNRSGTESPKRFDILYKFLRDFLEHPRVLVSAGSIVPLLEIFFDVTVKHLDSTLAFLILKVILERSTTIFPVADLEVTVQKVFAAKIIILMQQYPCFLAEAKQDIHFFLCNSKNPSGDLCTNIIWALGQFMSAVQLPDGTLEFIRDYYDTMESLLYEHLHSCTPRTLCIIMATLVKMASHNQDLMPRVLLVTNKINNFAKTSTGSEWGAVVVRTEEYQALLGEPNVAVMTLSPSISSLSGRHHQDVASLSMLWKAASALAPFYDSQTSKPAVES